MALRKTRQDISSSVSFALLIIDLKMVLKILVEDLEVLIKPLVYSFYQVVSNVSGLSFDINMLDPQRSLLKRRWRIWWGQ